MLILNYRHCDETLIKMYFSKVFRHGEKVPHKEFQNYPNDPYRDYSYYPLGSGDLTNVSKKKKKKDTIWKNNKSTHIHCI